MKKIRINMLSSASKVPGQGVGAAYEELKDLIKKYGNEFIELSINGGVNYDILHAQTIDIRNYFKFFIAKKAVKVMHVHFLPNTLDGSIKIPKLIFKALKKYTISFYKMADYLVVVNSALIPDMVKAGLDENKIRYIPNFVSNNTFYRINDKKRKNIRQRYNIKEDDFVVLGAGQLQNRKGVKDFIEIAQKLPDVKFIWAGGFSFGRITDGYNDIREIIKNLPSNVIFTGIVSRKRMNYLYNISDLFFLPSYAELFPMTILEASSCGKPVLLRNLELYKKILGEWYAHGDNNNDFIKQINCLKDDKEYYNLQVNNANCISKTYSEEIIWKQWEDFIKSISM